MTQNRNPPAYQEYAASMLASKEFRLMTLEQRGFLYTLKLECWENQQVPSEHEELAKYLGVQVDEINRAFTPSQYKFFSKYADFILCPELEDYKQHLNGIREAKSKGGKKSASNRASKLKVEGSTNLQVSSNSLVKLNSVKTSQAQSLESGNTTEWVNAYDRASNG